MRSSCKCTYMIYIDLLSCIMIWCWPGPNVNPCWSLQHAKALTSMLQPMDNYVVWIKSYNPLTKKKHRQQKNCWLSINCWDTLQQFHNLCKSPSMYFCPRRSRTSLGAENRTVSADFPSWPDGIYQMSWKFQWPRNMETCNKSLYCILYIDIKIYDDIMIYV